jgi:hypothetical protein
MLAFRDFLLNNKKSRFDVKMQAVLKRYEYSSVIINFWNEAT